MVSVAEHAEAELTRYEQVRDSMEWGGDSDVGFYGRAALEFGLRIEAMEAEWARWVVEEIDRRSN